MENGSGRWKRPGIRLATLLLMAVAVYFLVIFVKQSLNLYDLMQRVREEEARVTQAAQENEQLRRQLEGYRDWRLWAKALGYKEPGEKTAIPVEKSAGTETGRSETEEQGTPVEELAALPTWQKWLWILFVGTGR
ncbi:MAG: hypothetical protein ACP5OO_05835 [Chloroflexia bacterium]